MAGRSGEAVQFPRAGIDIRGGYSRLGWLSALGTRGFHRPLFRSFNGPSSCHGSERDGRDVPQPEIQASRFGRRSTPLYFRGRTGCEHYNTNPRFQPRGSESTLICLRISLLSLA